MATKGALLDRVAAVVNDGVVLNSELDDQMAIVSDALSGGPLCIWKDDAGIQTVEVDPTVQAIKELTDEGFNPLTMKFEGLDANGVLTKRIQAIVDERIAKERERAA